MREYNMRVQLDDGAYMPERAHATDAGLDLRAREDKLVPPKGSATFDTGEGKVKEGLFPVRQR